MSSSSDDGYLSLAYPLGEGAGVRLFSITYSQGFPCFGDFVCIDIGAGDMCPRGR